MNTSPKLPPPIVQATRLPPVSGTIPPQVRDRSPLRWGLHPSSAVALLGLDNLLFGAEAISLGLAWPMVSAAAFVLTGTTVFLLQAGLQKDRWWLAALKSLVCAVLAAVPTSLGGTILATLVLAWAGLSRLTQGKPQP